MTKRLIFLTWLLYGLTSCSPADTPAPPSSDQTMSPLPPWAPGGFTAPSLDSPDSTFVHTVSRYVGPDGQTAFLQNSFPKGGSYIEPGGEVGYTAADGTRYGIGIFWTRVVNEGIGPLTLSLTFPADPFALDGKDAYYRLSLPTDTMTLAKRSEFNYGIRGLKSFLDENLYRPTSLQRTLAAGEESLFYVVLLIHAPRNGAIRTAVEADEDGALRYRVRVEPFGEQSFPAGRIAF